MKIFKILAIIGVMAGTIIAGAVTANAASCPHPGIYRVIKQYDSRYSRNYGKYHYTYCKKCNSKVEESDEAHTFSSLTCTQAKKCSVCLYVAQEEPGHAYTSKRTFKQYLKSEATCISPAIYYYSCSGCYAKGTSTFTSGSALGHTYTAKRTFSRYLADKAKCTSAAKYYYSCSRCYAKGASTFTSGRALEHNYTAKRDALYHWKQCSCGKTTEKAKHTRTPYKVPDKNYHTRKCQCGYSEKVYCKNTAKYENIKATNISDRMLYVVWFRISCT